MRGNALDMAGPLFAHAERQRQSRERASAPQARSEWRGMPVACLFNRLACPILPTPRLDAFIPSGAVLGRVSSDLIVCGDRAGTPQAFDC